MRDDETTDEVAIGWQLVRLVADAWRIAADA